MKIIIPGIPTAQKRHRFVKRGNFIQTYDPSSKDKENVKSQIKDQITKDRLNPDIILWPLFNPGKAITVSLTFDMPIPKSTAKKRFKEVLNSPHIFKYDIDNMEKFYLDCMTGIIYKDDCVINKLIATKCYSETPKTTIEIEESP